MRCLEATISGLLSSNAKPSANIYFDIYNPQMFQLYFLPFENTLLSD
jgi:hypothetical protein